MNADTVTLLCTRLSPAKATELREALERARVVGVLDAWADEHSGYSFRTDTEPGDCYSEEPWLCHVASADGRKVSAAYKKLAGRGETPDAARAAAAKAIEAGEV